MHLERRISEPWSTCGTGMPLRRYVPPIVLLTFPCGNNRREADGKTIMKSTQILEAEHHVIQKVAEACGVLADEMQNGAHMPVGVLQSLVAFLGIFGGQYHHEKERWLLSMLRVNGMPPGTWPIVTLNHENLRLASLVNELAIAVEAYSEGAAGATSTIATILCSVAELYSDHIWKEDYVLLPMADKLFSETDQQVLEIPCRRLT